MSEDQKKIHRRAVVAIPFDIEEAAAHAVDGKMPVMTLQIPSPCAMVGQFIKQSDPPMLHTPGQALERRAIPVVLFEIDPDAPVEDHHFVLGAVSAPINSDQAPPKVVAVFPTSQGGGLVVYEVLLPPVSGEDQAQHEAVQSDGSDT